MSMRKALIGLILAATVMTPVTAEAQRGRRGDGPRVENQNGPDGDEGRPARAAQRQQQREARQAEQQQVQVQVQQPAPAPVVQRERGGNRGGGGDGNRNWRGNDNNTNNTNNNAATNNGGDRGNGWQGRQRNTQPSIYPQAWQGDPNDPRLRRYQETERRNQQRYGNDGRRGDDRRDWRNDRNDRNWRGGDRDGRRNDWNRNWRNDNRYDWQRWRYSNRNIFRIGPYYSPYRNYGYNRFDIGILLEPLFYSQRYWIGDPWQYRLPPAYPGTQWVRYYNDVVLVDIYSGEVLDIIYDFFW
jgi:hypothetical protein